MRDDDVRSPESSQGEEYLAVPTPGGEQEGGRGTAEARPRANVFFAHSGTHRYFVEAVAAASRLARVHTLALDAAETPLYRDFRAHYVHHSGKSRTYELWCFKRHFALLDFMRATGIEDAWLLDSDFLLLKPLPERQEIPGGYCGLSIPGAQRRLEWVASPHCSFWTVEALASFCAFAIATYRDRAAMLADTYRERAKAGLRGAISDMTLLYLWAEGEPRVANLFNFSRGGIIDHNIRVLTQPDGTSFQEEFRMKKLSFAGDAVHAETTAGARVPLYGIHFQGMAKVLIQELAARRYTRFRLIAAARSASSIYRRTLLKLRGA